MQKMTIYYGIILTMAVQTATAIDLPTFSLTRHVSTNGSSQSPYLTKATGARSIQTAINAASVGDTILVHEGTYILNSEITVSKEITIKSVNGPTVTIVDANGNSRCFNLGNTDCTLSGFTIQNGHVSDAGGGGVYCTGTMPVITNCIISGNSANYGGGSHRGTLYNCILSDNTSTNNGGGSWGGVLNSCTLIANSANGGGGSSGGTLNNCTLTGNLSTWNGGGSHRSTLNNCSLIANSAMNFGGGSSECSLNNCTLTGNSAENLGGGSYLDTLNNCTLTGNSSGFKGGGCSGSHMTNCIVYYNTAPTNANWRIEDSFVDYCCSTPDLNTLENSGGHNITEAPLFVDAAGRLRPDSPCIDAGTRVAHITSDIEGTIRPLDGRGAYTYAYDIGAYEMATRAGDTDGDGLSDYDELHTYHSDLMSFDSDGDGRFDGVEAAAEGYSPVYVEENLGGDLSMGHMLIQVSDGLAHINLQLQQSTSLTEPDWSNIGNPISWSTVAASNAVFYRIRASE
jgi:hypothetical protein